MARYGGPFRTLSAERKAEYETNKRKAARWREAVKG